jgi:hypothetical protein
VGTWYSIATGTTCLIVTIVGLILSFIAWRKKGLRSGIRGVAWSLLPISMYLTHAIGLVGRIGSAIVQFGASFVFSPEAWLGVVLVCVSALLFLISGGIPLFQSGRKRDERERDGRSRSGRHRDDTKAGASGSPARRPSDGTDGDDLDDVQEILRRRGIQ